MSCTNLNVQCYWIVLIRWFGFPLLQNPFSLVWPGVVFMAVKKQKTFVIVSNWPHEWGIWRWLVCHGIYHGNRPDVSHRSQKPLTLREIQNCSNACFLVLGLIHTAHYSEAACRGHLILWTLVLLNDLMLLRQQSKFSCKSPRLQKDWTMQCAGFPLRVAWLFQMTFKRLNCRTDEECAIHPHTTGSPPLKALIRT